MMSSKADMHAWPYDGPSLAAGKELLLHQAHMHTWTFSPVGHMLAELGLWHVAEDHRACRAFFWGPLLWGALGTPFQCEQLPRALQIDHSPCLDYSHMHGGFWQTVIWQPATSATL